MHNEGLPRARLLAPGRLTLSAPSQASGNALAFGHALCATTLAALAHSGRGCSTLKADMADVSQEFEARHVCMPDATLYSFCRSTQRALTRAWASSPLERMFLVAMPCVPPCDLGDFKAWPFEPWTEVTHSTRQTTSATQLASGRKMRKPAMSRLIAWWMPASLGLV